VFALLAALVNWFPLITGFTLHQQFLKVHFYVLFTGVNLTFFPMHFLGLSGIPRRYADYPDSIYFWNCYATIGAFQSSISVLFFIFILYESLRRQRPALFIIVTSSSLEFIHSIPPIDHRYTSVPVIFAK